MVRWSLSRTARLRIMLMVSVLTLLPATVQSQITFEWKTARRDTLYATVEECLGLIERIQWQTKEVDTTNLDLRPLPFRLQVVPNTVSDMVTQTARQCSQKFTVTQLLAPDSLEYPRMMNTIELFLKAKRNADILALIEGWGDKFPASQDTIKNRLRYEAARMALGNYPIRLMFGSYPTPFALIRQLADSIEFSRFWNWKIRVYGEVMNRARALKDTAEYESAVAWLITTPRLLGDSVMKADAWLAPGEIYGAQDIPVSSYVQGAQSYAKRDIILAKLRENVDSFRVFMTVLQKELGFKEPPRSLTVAKPIVAEYWFPEKPATSRPTVPGKISVVYRIKDNICYPRPCYHADNPWGRVARKFPEIEFTGLMRTWGHYGHYFGMLPPDQEAKLLDSIHRKVSGFTGVLAIHRTEFWRIDSQYDRRQVEEPGPNEEQYPLMTPSTPPLIIDWNGNFLNSTGADLFNLDMDPDVSLELFFEALLRSKPK